MWGRRSNGAAVADHGSDREPERQAVSADDLDAAVETLTAVLRGFGRYAFDVEEMDARCTNDLCERWARHLLYAAPRPTGPPTNLPPDRRDWFGVRHFVTQQRQTEYAYVTRSMGGMRQAIWSFIQELHHSMADDHETGQTLAVQLDRIHAATKRATVAEMRQEIGAAVSAITRSIEARKRRQQQQVETLYSEIRELGSQLEEARQESSLDGLTGLYNRKTLDQILTRTAAMSAVFDQKACLLLVDADHFKAINDTHGHDAGDRVLRSLADCLSRSFPRKGDCIARYGGEEFALVFSDASLPDGRRMAERILKSVADMKVDVDGKPLSVTVSIGLAAIHPGDSAEAWLKRADQALYRAKKLGRDRYEVF